MYQTKETNFEHFTMKTQLEARSLYALKLLLILKT